MGRPPRDTALESAILLVCGEIPSHINALRDLRMPGETLQSTPKQTMKTGLTCRYSQGPPLREPLDPEKSGCHSGTERARYSSLSSLHGAGPKNAAGGAAGLVGWVSLVGPMLSGAHLTKAPADDRPCEALPSRPRQIKPKQITRST